MSLVQMNIRSVVVGKGPVPSLVVLQPMERDDELPGTLPINIGAFEATAISMGLDSNTAPRPMTHDLLVSLIRELGATLKEVRVTEVHGTTFFAQVVAEDQNGSVHLVDARPSDSIALAVRVGAPIYVERDVLLTAALPDFRSIEHDRREQEMASFHSFVEELSPEDFASE